MVIDNYQVSLKLFVKNQQGEVLILKNPSHFSHAAGFYDFPWGRIDVDEFQVSYFDILKREVKEELGSNIQVKLSIKPVSISRLENIKSRNRLFHIFFEARYISWEIQISEEHESYKWVKLDEIDLEKHFMSGMLEGVKNYLEYK